jgi:hypothetical protein
VSCRGFGGALHGTPLSFLYCLRSTPCSTFTGLRIGLMLNGVRRLVHPTFPMFGKIGVPESTGVPKPHRPRFSQGHGDYPISPTFSIKTRARDEFPFAGKRLT